jgi:single-stranded-DNA-specific exonuclease
MMLTAPLRVSLVSSYLKLDYPDIATYIPDRYLEDGISYRGIDFAEDNGFTLIIALDCGIKSIDRRLHAKINRLTNLRHHRPEQNFPMQLLF